MDNTKTKNFSLHRNAEDLYKLAILFVAMTDFLQSLIHNPGSPGINKDMIFELSKVLKASRTHAIRMINEVEPGRFSTR